MATLLKTLLKTIQFMLSLQFIHTHLQQAVMAEEAYLQVAPVRLITAIVKPLPLLQTRATNWQAF